MNNFLSRYKPALSSLAAVLFGLFIFVPVMASPSGTPPTSNVDPNFNSVTTGTIKNPNGTVQVSTSQGLFVWDPVALKGFQVLPDGTFNTITTNNQTSTTIGNLTNTVNQSNAAQYAAPFSLKNASNQTVFKVDTNGDLSNPAATYFNFSQGVNTKDLHAAGTSQGLSGTASSTSGVGVAGTANVSSGIGIYGTATGPGGIGGSFTGTSDGVFASSAGIGGFFANSVSNYTASVGSTSYAIDAKGPSNLLGNVTVTGNVTASQGFGKISVASGSSGNIPANTYAFAGTATCPNINSRVLSCSFSATKNVVLADTIINAGGYSCNVYVKNTDTISPWAVTPKVICFDPAGSPW